jgi:hypothetical protein
VLTLSLGGDVVAWEPLGAEHGYVAYIDREILYIDREILYID